MYFATGTREAGAQAHRLVWCEVTKSQTGPSILTSATGMEIRGTLQVPARHSLTRYLYSIPAFFPSHGDRSRTGHKTGQMGSLRRLLKHFRDSGLVIRVTKGLGLPYPSYSSSFLWLFAQRVTRNIWIPYLLPSKVYRPSGSGYGW